MVNFLENLIIFILTIFIAISAIQLILYTFLLLVGIKKPEKEYEMKEDKLSFLFLIPSCNEEYVIKDTLKNLKNLNYDKNLYDVITLVNNSTDNTFNVSQSLGVKTLDIKFGDDEPKGKPYVLKKFFDNNECWRNFDYIVILDADNIISPLYLKEMNSQILCEKYKDEEIICVQGYLGIKNILSSLVSAGYSASYFCANRGFQLANHRLNKNPAIGGTGFALKTTYVIERGWNPKSYTEDFELQVELAMNSQKILWNHFAVVYDEKPTTVKASHKQRTRWCQGHWFVAISTTPKQIMGMIKAKTLHDFLNRFFTFVYSYSMIRVITIFFILCFSVTSYRIRDLIPTIWSMMPIWFVCGLVNYIIIPVYYISTEGKDAFVDKFTKFQKVKNFIKIYVGFFYASIIYIGAQVKGFFTCFKPQNNWVKTEHKMSDENVIWNDSDFKEKNM